MFVCAIHYVSVCMSVKGVNGPLQDGVNEAMSLVSWEQLLDADNPHKLMYSLQIVESLSRPPKFCRNSYDVSLSFRQFVPVQAVHACYIMLFGEYQELQCKVIGFCYLIIINS